MLWTGLTVAFGKSMSVISQLVLGYVLTVDAYAVFAAATAALTFVTGFQNSGLSKVLIQQQEEYDRALPDFAGFALYLGLAGGALLIVMGFVLSDLYRMPALLPVLCISALTVPLFSLNSIYAAKQSIDLRFQAASFYSMSYSFIYYTGLIVFAVCGAAYLSVAISTLIAVGILHLLYARRMGLLRINLTFSRATMASIADPLKWTIVSSYLFGFALNGDYLVLGRFLEKDQLGYYFFGFMLTANIGQLLSLAINQTLMPIFSKLRGDPRQLRHGFERSCEAINFVSAVMCIGMIGLLPDAVHLVWQGKWDAAIFVAVAMAVSFPLRMMATMGAVALEAQGLWRQRTLLLCQDAACIMIFAAVGALLGGINGAAVAVAIHRCLTGIIAFPAAMRAVGFEWPDIAAKLVRLPAPFLLSVSVIFLAKSIWRPEMSLQSAAVSLVISAAALAIFLILTFFINRPALTYVAATIRRRRG